MPTLKEIKEKRENEIKDEREDKENYDKAVSAGIGSAIKFGLVGLIPAFIIGGILSLIFSKGGHDPFWVTIIFYGIIFGFAYLGYKVDFFENRTKRNDN